MELTLQQLKQILPKNPYVEHWFRDLSQLLPDYEINTPQRIAAFMAQTTHESGDYIWLQENLNYKPATLRKIFPKYFPDDGIANEYCSRPNKAEAIAKNTELGKRRGRPPKAKPVVEVVKLPSIAEACHTLIDVLQQHKNLYLSFDTSRTAVEVMWNDDVYHVAPEEVTRLAECVDYLESRRLTYSLV